MAPAGQSFVRSSPVIPDRNGNLCFVTRCIRQYNAIPRYDANDAVVVSHRDFPVPALAVAWLCSADPAAYLCIKRKVDTKILLLALVSMFLMSPAITLTALLNKQMILPEFMAPVESWMKAQEALAEQITNTLLAGDGMLTFLSNLFVIAIMAGITEEFLFRGALQRIIGQWTSNHHIVIWSAAILFSAFHLQFYGFLPRMLLGAYFGYLLYWSRNIWIPVFAHFVNNAFAVISMSDIHLRENEFITGDISNANLLPYSALAVVTLVCSSYAPGTSGDFCNKIS